MHKAEDHPGVGIGLSLARRAAERMGGTVGLASEPGSGSLFWIELEHENALYPQAEGQLSAARTT